MKCIKLFGRGARGKTFSRKRSPLVLSFVLFYKLLEHLCGIAYRLDAGAGLVELLGSEFRLSADFGSLAEDLAADDRAVYLL